MRGARLSFQVPDTISGRTLTLNVKATSPSGLGIVGLSYSLDGSLPTLAATTIANGGGRVRQTSDSTWTAYVSEALPPGRHRVTIGAFDAGGEVASVAATFESRIDTVLYNLVPLPTLGGTFAQAIDINQRGIVSGTALDTAGVLRPVTWTNGQAAALPDGGTGIATALNDAGVVVGTAQDPRMTRACRRPVVWRNGGAPTTLPAYPATTAPDTASACTTGVFPGLASLAAGPGMPTAVNARGTILTERFLDASGAVRALVPGDDYVDGWALNDVDQAVFSASWSPEYGLLARGIGVVVSGPAGAELGAVSGSFRRYEYIGGIDASGNVVGTLIQYLRRAFLSHPDGRSTDLGPITGNLDGLDITDSGDVLLGGSDGAGVAQAYRLRGDRLASIVVAEPGWTLGGIRKMNNAGQIIGWAKDASGVSRAVLLTPVP